MPMTEKLQKALMTPDTTPDQIADLMKRDGVNCRDSITLDTPLILSARYNNLKLINHIISLIKKSPDKSTILNSRNKLEVSALSEALKVPNDKKIALILLQNGASSSVGIGHDLPVEEKKWLKPFEDYNELKDIKSLSEADRARRASAEFETGNRYYRDLGDAMEAIKWFELAAKDGHKQGMLNIALYHKENGDITEAVNWYKKSYFMWPDEKNRDAIVTHLKNIAETTDGNIVAKYKANMTLGCSLADAGNVTTALIYFRTAQDQYVNLPEKHAADEMFFRACALWDGPSHEHNISILDYLDFTKRFELLIQSGTTEGLSLLKGIALASESKVLQLIACQIAHDQKILDESFLAPLKDPANQIFIQALASLYGWNGQPKNTLRAASQFKKILEVTKVTDTETAYLSSALIAFAYLQQERERDAYISEAFKSLDQAHACLHKTKSPHRKEIIRVLADGVSYVK